eukprot:m.252075 g.252075  ORF g.252075 m.252075 type:complete len:409 (+) comp19551_c0_seq1:262-1488(+)
MKNGACNTIAVIAFCWKIVCGNGACLDARIGFDEHAYVMKTNSFVIPIMIIGAGSIVLCLGIIATILAYKKDTRSLRERLILGLIVGNLIFSISNASPISLFHSTNCATVVTIKNFVWIRGIWLSGKFVIVCYEVAIIGTSIYSLRTGKTSIKWSREFCVHLVCFLVGIIIFISWCLLVFERASEASRVAAAFETGVVLHQYSSLSEEFEYIQSYSEFLAQKRALIMRFWLCPMALLVGLWIISRYMYSNLLREWNSDLSEAEDVWARDLWSAQDQGVVSLRRQLFHLRKQACEEIVKPLDPYVVVFVVFAIPGIVLTTDWCAAHSKVPLFCSIPCELVLAMRSIATAFIYLSVKENRQQLFAPRKLLHKLWLRVASCFRQHRHEKQVSFIDAVNIRLIEPRENILTT